MSKAIEKKMGETPLGKLLFSMALPMMLSMLVQALYNVVDSVYVSRISEDALTALSLAFPVQNMMIAVGVGTAIGVNSYLSRKLGERDYETAGKVAGNGIFLALLSWLLFVVFGLFFCRVYFESFNASETVVQMGVDYLSVCTIWCFGMFVVLQLERFMQSTGRSLFSMATQFLGAIINIIFDPIFIFGYFGLPAMGVKGAAIATVLGQIVSMFLGMYIQKRYVHEIEIQIKGFRPNWRVIGQIYAVGFPSILMQSIGTILTIGMNRIFISYSEVAVAFYGVLFKLQSFIFMPVFGLNNAVVPIVGYNYGARKPERIKRVLVLACIVAECIMLLGVAAMMLIPERLLGIFEASEAMLAVGVPALRIVCWTYFSAAIVITFSSTFQALGKGFHSLILSVLRQLVIILPSAWILGRLYGLNAIWYGLWIADIAALIVASLLMRGTMKMVNKLSLPQPQPKPQED